MSHRFEGTSHANATFQLQLMRASEGERERKLQCYLHIRPKFLFFYVRVFCFQPFFLGLIVRCFTERCDTCKYEHTKTRKHGTHLK